MHIDILLFIYTKRGFGYLDQITQLANNDNAQARIPIPVNYYYYSLPSIPMV